MLLLHRFLSEALNNVSFSDADADKQKKLQQILSFNLASELQHLKLVSEHLFCPLKVSSTSELSYLLLRHFIVKLQNEKGFSGE